LIDDIDNQSAPSIARQHDKLGLRTIGIFTFCNAHIEGVLTKPDAVGDGEHDLWVRVINNESHALHHGYYMTRLPANEKELNMDWTQARLMESNYLTGHQRWGKLDRTRLGTPKLADQLSKRLSDMIEEMYKSFCSISLIFSLPGLKMQVCDKLKAVESELAELPESLAEQPQSELTKLCTKFVKDVEIYASGQLNDNPRQRSFIRDALPYYRSLKHLILSTRPQFKVELSRDQSANGIVLETTPQPPPLQAASPPVTSGPEIERISSKMLNRRAPNQGIWLLDPADIRDIPGIRTKGH
jgi:hypothetical protein